MYMRISTYNAGESRSPAQPLICFFSNEITGSDTLSREAAAGFARDARARAGDGARDFTWQRGAAYIQQHTLVYIDIAHVMA